MGNPIINNVAIITRFDRLALASALIVDGATISVDGVIRRGAVLVKSSGKWHQYVHGTDVVAVDAVRILQDDVKVVAGVDAYGVGYFEGFFSVLALKDATAGLVDADLLLAAGFHVIETDEVRLK
jgi:hypothetical protein